MILQCQDLFLTGIYWQDKAVAPCNAVADPAGRTVMVWTRPSFNDCGVAHEKPCNPLSPKTDPTSERDPLAVSVPTKAVPS